MNIINEKYETPLILYAYKFVSKSLPIISFLFVFTAYEAQTDFTFARKWSAVVMYLVFLFRSKEKDSNGLTCFQR